MIQSTSLQWDLNWKAQQNIQNPYWHYQLWRTAKSVKNLVFNQVKISRTLYTLGKIFTGHCCSKITLRKIYIYIFYFSYFLSQIKTNHDICKTYPQLILFLSQLSTSVFILFSCHIKVMQWASFKKIKVKTWQKPGKIKTYFVFVLFPPKNINTKEKYRNRSLKK